MRNFDVQVPVLAVSDHRDMDSMTTALGLGAASFFVNPAEKPGLVKRAIERSVHHRQLQRDLVESNESLERANTELSHSLRIPRAGSSSGPSGPESNVSCALPQSRRLLVQPPHSAFALLKRRFHRLL
jgi:hypothetical protein